MSGRMKNDAVSNGNRIFTSFASGIMTKEAFLHKKEVINNSIGRKRLPIKKWSETFLDLTEGRKAVESVISEWTPLRSLESLDNEIVDLLIDRIIVYSETNIEIIWNGDF